MLDGFGIQGIKPIDKDSSKHQNGKNRKHGEKFTLDGKEAKKEKSKRSKPDRPRKTPPADSGGKPGGIDIVI